MAHAKHVAPREIQSITNNGVYYVVPNDKGLRAYVEARDVQTGRQLWAKTIFRHWYVPIPFGPTECMHYEYLDGMTLLKDELVLTSERGRMYALHIHTKALRRMRTKEPNKASSAGNGAVACRFHSAAHKRAVPEMQRYAKGGE